ncbi:MAG: tRNA (guanosine(37)-N1)-methyltransferase TrmD [Sphingomonadaceae bacterium]
MTFHAQIITLYPEMFPGPLGVSIAGRALAEGRWSCTPIQLRDFATDKHRTVDDTPAGGGAGMVLRADVLARAVDFATAQILPACGEVAARSDDGGGREEELYTDAPLHHALRGPQLAGQLAPGNLPSGARSGEDLPIIALTPRGTPITQDRIRALAQGPGVTLICGRFEGFDERLFDAYPQIEQVSVGDIILSGGEPAALMLLDACIRLLPGVMGASSSGFDESFENGLLEYPQYTRPAEWEGRMIPQVLRSGDHAKVEAWRKAKSEADTRLRRPDLWERHVGTRVQPASGAQRENKD